MRQFSNKTPNAFDAELAVVAWENKKPRGAVNARSLFEIGRFEDRRRCRFFCETLTHRRP
jgi:hypothetical protein